MKHLSVFLSAALLLSAFVLSAQAQTDAAGGDLTNDVKAASSYNKSKNETTYEVALLPIPNAVQKVTVSVSVSFPGDKLKK